MSSHCPDPEKPEIRSMTSPHDASSCPFGHIDGMCAGEAFGLSSEGPEMRLMYHSTGPTPEPLDTDLESGRDPHVESFDDPWVSGSIIDDESDKGATAVYDQMVHRTTDGPDPLVPEP